MTPSLSVKTPLSWEFISSGSLAGQLFPSWLIYARPKERVCSLRTKRQSQVFVSLFGRGTIGFSLVLLLCDHRIDHFRLYLPLLSHKQSFFLLLRDVRLDGSCLASSTSTNNGKQETTRLHATVFLSEHRLTTGLSKDSQNYIILTNLLQIAQDLNPSYCGNRPTSGLNFQKRRWGLDFLEIRRRALYKNYGDAGFHCGIRPFE